LAGCVLLCALTGPRAANAQQAGNGAFPDSLLGSWQVDSVLIDTGATRTFLYQRNDPRLKGRIVAMTPGKITTDLVEDKFCGAPTAAGRRTTLGALVADTMAERGVPSKKPTSTDYKFEIPASAALQVWSVSCAQGALGPDGRRNGTWIATLPDGSLAMRWYDQTILRLKKLPENARPSPSFACAKAAADAEKAICGSVSLAAFDRSVADAYAAVAKLYSDPDDRDDLQKLRSAQREWIVKRNACKADAACLEKSMQGRLEELASVK
jgi:uncharacterized protein YecT (DUF1311 family)